MVTDSGEGFTSPHAVTPAVAAALGRVGGRLERVLVPGDVVEFATQQPHWFGSTGQEPAEILSIFSRPGERMSVRTPEQHL